MNLHAPDITITQRIHQIYSYNLEKRKKEEEVKPETLCASERCDLRKRLVGQYTKPIVSKHANCQIDAQSNKLN